MKIEEKIRNFSIKKDFFTIAIILILVAIFFAIIIVINNKRAQDYKNVALLRSSLNRIESSFTGDINYTSYQMLYISDQIRKNGVDPKYIYKLLSSYNFNSKINVAITWNMFSWMNKNKLITIDGNIGILPKPVNIADRDYVDQTILQPNKLKIGRKTVYGAVSKQLIIPAGMGVVDKNNKYIGSIVFGFDVKSLIYKLDFLINNKNVNFALVDEDGDIVAQSTFNSYSKSNKDFIKNLIKNNQESEIIIKPKSIFDNNNSYFYYKKIPEIGYGVIVGYDKSTLSSELFKANYVMQFLIIALITLIILIVINQKIIKPIVKIGKAAEDIALHKDEIDLPQKGVSEIISIAKQLSLINQYKKNLINANKRIEQLNIAKSSFLSSVSHELQSPMVSIKLISSALSDDQMNGEYNIEDYRNYMKDIKLLSEESLEFVGDLLDVGQAESGNFTLGKLSDEDVSYIITRAIKIVKGRAQKSSIKIKTKIEENLPKLHCDPKRIKQILVNLLTNSIKYSKDGTVINVEAQRCDDDKIKIIITDQGFGMDEDEVKLAMQNYVTVKNENSDRVDSFGLGLPLVHHLVKLSGGEFNISSKKGEGTRVEIILKNVL